MPTTRETELHTYSTGRGTAVRVLKVEAERVTSLSQIAELSGATWRCDGCGEGADRPLTGSRLGDPARVMSGAALAHSQTCRS